MAETSSFCFVTYKCNEAYPIHIVTSVRVMWNEASKIPGVLVYENIVKSHHILMNNRIDISILASHQFLFLGDRPRLGVDTKGCDWSRIFTSWRLTSRS